MTKETYVTKEEIDLEDKKFLKLKERSDLPVEESNIL
eukprot:CAMPEP_0168324560 /NCGR_PEP_ID=MMETSP0213-20121227/4161_1 /TAXON_ID=151035 /ORGANISM="Euplotes harpa, Strain FSP1.4" /LENGTH=36 /DNA_ID= /DNA_START= /DNA_END= /DNA_ORIENTATION=